MRVRCFALVLALATTASAASAQGAREADALFTQGRDLLEKGRYAEACEKLKRSEDLAPAVGTLLNLGFCYEQTAKLRSAMEAYSEAEILARQAGDGKRAAFAKERIAAVEPRVMKLVVRVVPPEAPGIAITRGGKPMPKTDWNQPIAIDSEEIVVEATAPGYAPWRGVVAARGDGALVSLFVPPLASESPTAKAPAEPAAPPRATALGTKKVVALGLGGLGLAALGAGVGTGFAAKSRYDDADAHCDASGCDDVGLAERRSAVSTGNVGTVLVIVGLAAIGGGVALWLLDPAPSRAGVRTTMGYGVF